MKNLSTAVSRLRQNLETALRQIEAIEGAIDEAPEAETRRKSYGKRLQAARLAARWKQLDLAAAIGVNRVTLAKWESGLHAPSKEQQKTVAEVFKTAGAVVP